MTVWKDGKQLIGVERPERIITQRPWVGLTDEERVEIFNRMDWVIDFDWEYELAIEAKLKEKNT